MCKIRLILTIELEMIELYIVITPVSIESVSEKNPQVFIYCLCQLFVIQAEFSLLDLFFNQTLCFMCLERRVLTVSWKWELCSERKLSKVGGRQKPNSRNRTHSCYSNQDQGLLRPLLVATGGAIYSKTKWEKQREVQIWKSACPKVHHKGSGKTPSLPCHWSVAATQIKCCCWKLESWFLFNPREALGHLKDFTHPLVCHIWWNILYNSPNSGGNHQTLCISDMRGPSQSRAGDWSHFPHINSACFATDPMICEKLGCRGDAVSAAIPEVVPSPPDGFEGLRKAKPRVAGQWGS